MSDQRRTNEVAASELERTVEEIRRMLDRVRHNQRALRWRMTLGTIVILILVIGFSSLGYFKLKENFARDKVQEAAATRVRLLLPQLEPVIRTTLSDVAPYYAEVGQQRLQRLSPLLSARVTHQTDQLAQELETQMNGQLQDFFNRISNHATVQLQKDFPGVTADDGNRIGDHLRTVLVARNDKLLAAMNQFYKEENRRIGDSIARFSVPDVKTAEMEALQKRLLHDVLMLADHEMTGAGTAQMAGAHMEAQK